MDTAQLAHAPLAALDLKERVRLVAVTLALALLLTAGFIPTAHSFFDLLWRSFGLGETPHRDFYQMLSFPLLAGLFLLSMPAPPAPSPVKSVPWALLRTAPLPLLISFFLGYVRPNPSVFQTGLSEDFYWYAAIVPVGEEWLFRGWLYHLIERWWPHKLWGFTNPLPAAVWASSAAFSLWHLQNLAALPVAMVLFQVFYTFFAGLWLGYLRWKSGGLLLPIVMHSALNLCTLLI